jgi:beta-N-acetylhexosaminidase
MMKRCVVIEIVVIALLAVAAEAQRGGLGDTIAPERPAPPPSASGEPSGPQPHMALRRQVAQLMIVALEGRSGPSSGDLHLLERYTPGGVVIGNLTQPSDASQFIQSVRRVGEREHPLFIGTDLYTLATQGTSSIRQFVQLPAPLSMAAADHPSSVRRVAGLLAEHLVSMGFNLHVGPSLELASTLPDATGSVHRFGSDPGLTATAGKAIVETLLSRGVLTMPVGFPGGGANRRDGGPAINHTPSSLLEAQDLKPYLAAIEAGAALIHVGPTLVPLLDPESVPACVSAAVMRGLLREKLAFEGIIVAGPMDSPDVTRYYDPGDAALKALVAGADMVYWATSRPGAVRATDMITQAVVDGRVPESLITEAYERVTRVKEAQGLRNRQTPKPKTGGRLSKKKEYPEETYQVERRAITLVQNHNNLLPLTDSAMPVMVTGVVGVEALKKALDEHIKPVSQHVITTAMHAGRIHTFEIDRVTRHTRGLRTSICIVSDAIPVTSQVELIEALQAKGIRVVAVVLGYPSQLEAFSVADAVVLTYADERAFGQSLRAVADILVGMAPLNVYPAVRPLKTTVGKKERFNVYDLVRAPSGRLPVTIGRFESGLAISYDSAHTLKRVDWDFGDGKRSKQAETEHAYSAPGAYRVTLTLTERSGDTTSQVYEVIVE